MDGTVTAKQPTTTKFMRQKKKNIYIYNYFFPREIYRYWLKERRKHFQSKSHYENSAQDTGTVSLNFISPSPTTEHDSAMQSLGQLATLYASNCIHLVASSSASRFFSSFLVSVSFFTWARVSSSSALSFGYQLKLTLPIGGGDKSVTRCKYRTKSVLLIRRFSSVVIVVSA